MNGDDGEVSCINTCIGVPLNHLIKWMLWTMPGDKENYLWRKLHAVRWGELLQKWKMSSWIIVTRRKEERNNFSQPLTSTSSSDCPWSWQSVQLKTGQFTNSEICHDKSVLHLHHWRSTWKHKSLRIHLGLVAYTYTVMKLTSATAISASKVSLCGTFNQITVL